MLALLTESLLLTNLFVSCLSVFATVTVTVAFSLKVSLHFRCGDVSYEDTKRADQVCVSGTGVKVKPILFILFCPFILFVILMLTVHAYSMFYFFSSSLHLLPYLVTHNLLFESLVTVYLPSCYSYCNHFSVRHALLLLFMTSSTLHCVPIL